MLKWIAAKKKKKKSNDAIQRSRQNNDTNYVWETNQNGPQLPLKRSKTGRNQILETGHQRHQEGSWWRR